MEALKVAQETSAEEVCLCYSQSLFFVAMVSDSDGRYVEWSQKRGDLQKKQESEGIPKINPETKELI